MAARFTISTYTNKKGDARIGVQMPREVGLRFAIGDQEGYELLEELRLAIKKRVEREEGAVQDGS